MKPNSKGTLLSSLISANDKISFVFTLDQRQSFSGPLNIAYSKFFTWGPERAGHFPKVTQQDEWQSGFLALSPVLLHLCGLPGPLNHQMLHLTNIPKPSLSGARPLSQTSSFPVPPKPFLLWEEVVLGNQGSSLIQLHCLALLFFPLVMTQKGTRKKMWRLRCHSKVDFWRPVPRFRKGKTDTQGKSKTHLR